MYYVMIEWEHELDDEPYQIFSELDGSRKELRKVEFYRNGICFSYGAERGNYSALSQEPYPEDLREIERQAGEGEHISARAIQPGFFYEIWNQAQERPDGFMGMFF